MCEGFCPPFIYILNSPMPTPSSLFKTFFFLSFSFCNIHHSQQIILFSLSHPFHFRSTKFYSKNIFERSATLLHYNVDNIVGFLRESSNFPRLKHSTTVQHNGTRDSRFENQTKTSGTGIYYERMFRCTWEKSPSLASSIYFQNLFALLTQGVRRRREIWWRVHVSARYIVCIGARSQL
jgi:hypothetical protein